MQTNKEVSLPSANAAEIAPYTLVKMTSLGVAVAGAADRAIGYVLPGDLNREFPTIHLIGIYAELIQSLTEVIAVGDQLEQEANGKVKKFDGTGTAIGVAVTAGSTANGRIDAILY